MYIAILTILTGETHPALRTKTKPVAKVTKEIVSLLKDMEATTIEANGAGIAAPQVGRTERLCIAALDGKLTPLINPEIMWYDSEKGIAEEGCLSLPNIWLNIERSTSIRVKFLDAKGKHNELLLHGLSARVVQHEVDHLEGILIVDRAKNIERRT